MSMMNPSSGSAEVGETVASVREYEAAQKLVSRLIAAEVPARDISIVGMGVRTIERVTGRLGYATAARSGAMNGLLIGLFLSAIFVLGNPAAPIQAFVGVLFVGVAMGMILSLVTYAIVRRRRDYASVTQLAADHYEVTVLASSLPKARQALGKTPAPERPAVPTAVDAEPPRYGERVAPGTPQATPAPESSETVASHTPEGDVEPPRYGERIAPPPPPVAPQSAVNSSAAAAETSETTGTVPASAQSEPIVAAEASDARGDAGASGTGSDGSASSS